MTDKKIAIVTGLIAIALIGGHQVMTSTTEQAPDVIDHGFSLASYMSSTASFVDDE